jgi:peptidoglycan/LPS O-acetylase OafA/YrhL
VSDVGPASQPKVSIAVGRLLGVDILRALAALAVVFTHLPFALTYDATGAPISAYPHAIDVASNYGQYGVHVFLVLSGFCIHLQWARRTDGSPIDFFGFWRRRLRRLYPPYFAALVCTLAGLAVVTFASHAPVNGIGSRFGYASDSQFVLDVVLLVLLAQNLNGASMRVGNGPFWSLALEEQLYLLYFPLLAIRRRWGWRVALPLVAVVTIGWRLAWPIGPSRPHAWGEVGPSRWFEWVLGAIAVEAYLGKIRLPRVFASPWAALAAFAVGVAMAPPPGTWEFPGGQALSDSVFGLFGFIVLNWFCALEKRGSFSTTLVARGLARLGLMSYSLYLVHNPVMVVLKRVAVSAGITNVFAVTAIRLGGALGAAALFFWLVERHFLTRPRPSPAGAADAERRALAA